MSVCIPARNEDATVGSVVGRSSPYLAAAGGNGLVDEVIVIDDGSSDENGGGPGRRGPWWPGPGGGGRAAMGAGFDRRPETSSCSWTPTSRTRPSGSCPAWSARTSSDEAVLVKAFYERPINGEPAGGGRVTELVARPLLSLLFPALSGVRQPLAGERRLTGGYSRGSGRDRLRGRDRDADRCGPHFGAERLAQVDLGGACTGTGRSPSCGHRRWTCCGRRWTATLPRGCAALVNALSHRPTVRRE